MLRGNVSVQRATTSSTTCRTFSGRFSLCPTRANDSSCAKSSPPRVAYFSWTGHTCGLVDVDCQRDWNGEIVTPLLAPTYRALQALGQEANDGLVGVEAAQWGAFLGELPADHLDEVGLLFGSDAKVFDHIAFFLSEAERLFQAGF